MQCKNSISDDTKRKKSKFLEIKVSLTIFDALNAALQFVQELRVNVLEVVLDALPAFGGDFGSSVVHQVLGEGEDGIRRAVTLDEARHAEFHEVLTRSTKTVASRAEARDEVMVEEFVNGLAQAAVVANLELLAVQVLVLLLVAVFLLLLVVVFVVTDLEVGTTVDLGDAVFDGFDAEGGILAGGQNHTRIRHG